MPNLPLPRRMPRRPPPVKDWLARFAACVREVDYAAAYPFWHDAIVIFGTYQELVRSRQAWTDTQWDNVWPRTADFAFDLANTEVLASPDGAMAVAVTPLTSTGFTGRHGLPAAGPGDHRAGEAAGRALGRACTATCRWQRRAAGQPWAEGRSRRADGARGRDACRRPEWWPPRLRRV